MVQASRLFPRFGYDEIFNVAKEQERVSMEAWLRLTRKEKETFEKFLFGVVCYTLRRKVFINKQVKEIKAVGLAPEGTMCRCEREGCLHGTSYDDLSCRRKAFYVVEVYGLQQLLCSVCFKKQKLEAEE